MRMKLFFSLQLQCREGFILSTNLSIFSVKAENDKNRLSKTVFVGIESFTLYKNKYE